MPYLRVDLRVDGAASYSRAFQVYAHEAGDLSEPLRAIGDQLREHVGRQFLTEGSWSLGTPWAPLSPDYAEWKAANAPLGPAAPILVFSGAMRQAALSRQSTTVAADRLLYVVDSDYAIYHQRGTEHMPARPIVVLNEAFKRQIDRSFHEWLNSLRRGPLRRSPGALT